MIGWIDFACWCATCAAWLLLWRAHRRLLRDYRNLFIEHTELKAKMAMSRMTTRPFGGKR